MALLSDRQSLRHLAGDRPEADHDPLGKTHMSAILLLFAVPGVLCTGPTGPGSGTGPGTPMSAATAPLMAMPARPPSDSLEDVFRNGMSWEAFYAAADARRALWERNWTGATVPAELLERARAAGGPWRILAVTEPGCSDSVNTLPWIAKLAELLPSLELRLVDSKVGRPWMEAHRSPDGRASTPTVLVLDEQYRIRGCWIEQPAAVAAFWLDIVARDAARQEIDRKMSWYAEDAGRETLREFVEVLEGAKSGSIICPGAGGS